MFFFLHLHTSATPQTTSNEKYRKNHYTSLFLIYFVLNILKENFGCKNTTFNPEYKKEISRVSILKDISESEITFQSTFFKKIKIIFWNIQLKETISGMSVPETFIPILKYTPEFWI